MKQIRHITSPKNVLAIRFMRLGDVVLLLPALTRLKAFYPESRITLLTDDRCAPLAKMCPAIDEVMAVNRIEMRDGPRIQALKAMTGMIADVRRRRFDLVIDFLSFRETNLLTWLSRAPFRLGMKRHDRAYLPFCFNLPPVLEDKSLHVAEMFNRVVNASAENRSEPDTSDPRSALVLPDSIQEWASQVVSSRPSVALYVGAPVAVRRWPADHFARVADFAIQELGASVIVMAGPPEAETAERVRQFCQKPEQVTVFNKLSIPQMAALIAHSRLLISNDTGPMHIGPVFGVPTLGLFSVGYPEHYRPLGERSRFLRADPIENISTEQVIRQVREIWFS